ncbi:MAG: permease [Deltaproteobacteria bacterium]|nr:permease [Deltaproteobacteria bacterium]
MIAHYVSAYFSAFWNTTREVAPFLVVGLMLAGVLHVLVSPAIILWALGSSGFRGAVRGAVLGVPLPLCSCGVLPTALTLRRKGASLSSAIAFMISTPETSIDALAITAVLLPGVFLAVRPIAAIAMAILVGVIVERFAQARSSSAAGKTVSGAGFAPASAPSMAEVCRVCGLLEEKKHLHAPVAKVRAVLRYAFSTFFEDIGTWIVIGLLSAALIEVAVPASFFKSEWWLSHAGLQVVLATLVGIPLYSCATATTPFVATLIAKGLSPGAALVMLLTGPATSLSTFFVLRREFGGRITFLYYSSMIAVCLLMGTALNALWPMLSRFDGLTAIPGGTTARWFAYGVPGWLEVASAWLILLLTARIWIRLLRQPRADACCVDETADKAHAGHDHNHHSRRA